MPIKVFEPFTRLDASDVNEFLVNKGGFEFSETVYFTTSGDFVKADYPDARAIRVKVQGGGGAGGGAGAAAAGNASAGSGGGGGGYAEAFIDDVSSLAGTVAITVGAGGAGVSAAAGNAGGNSSFGTAIVADGGDGGVYTGVSSAFRAIAGADGGAATGGDLNIGGGGSSFVVRQTLTGGGSAGGTSTLGNGGKGTGSTSGVDGGNGFAGQGYGGGGGGAFNREVNTNRTGGDGAPGIVIIEIYK